MQATMTGRLTAFDDAQRSAELVMLRRSKQGPQAEPIALRFGSELSYQAFRARHALGEPLLLVGRLAQERVPLAGQGKRKPKDAQGRDMTDKALQLWVKDHRALPGLVSEAVESDLVVASGLAALVAEGELRVTEAGLPFWRGRVAVDQPKRSGQEATSDYYSAVAFGPLAERLAKLAKGERFLIEWAGVANPAYEAQAEDGPPVTRHSPELTVRDIRYLPRPRTELAS